MFHKLYLAGASPPRLPGAGPGHMTCARGTYKLVNTAFKEI